MVAHFGGEAATHPKPPAERPQGAQNPDIGKPASMVPLAWLHVKTKVGQQRRWRGVTDCHEKDAGVILLHCAIENGICGESPGSSA